MLAIRRPARAPTHTEIVDEALAAMAAGETPQPEPVSPPVKPARRFKRRPRRRDRGQRRPRAAACR